ncbi:polysaccharide pyruvyl transferase family protein [Solibacillus sp. FSL W7-1472]|uniref:polysaccharide pyruvyl transferase family protein n=1 Tax=Solibacillus sp. FSL W7-1472 TaxID=2921707 RepID=UPI0030DB1786
MKVGVLSGAYKNSGDFLIVERSIKLLKYALGEDIELNIFLRNQSLDSQIDEINNCDVLVFAGGPGYIQNLYPKVMPLVKDLNAIKAKIFILGMGWFSPNVLNETIYNYKFTEQTLELFERVLNDGFLLGCREYESTVVLKNNGVYGSVMTGCPAWYNLDVVTKPYEYQFNESYKIRNICFSDPANFVNYNNIKGIIDYLKERFPNSKLKYVFHRGMSSDAYTSDKSGKILNSVVEYLKSENIEYFDISYSADGFKVYNEADLHIGFRVHAHIYCLSNRKLSILFEEDGRGAGVNNALGLKNIMAYSLNGSINSYIVKNLDDYLFELESNNYYRIQTAFKNIENYFSLMLQHVQTIKEVLDRESCEL